MMLSNFFQKVLRRAVNPASLAKSISDRLQIRSLKAGAQSGRQLRKLRLNEVRKILVLDPYFPTMGGGEKEMGLFCQAMENLFPGAGIEVLVHDIPGFDIRADDYPQISELEKRFDTRLQRTSLLKLDLCDDKDAMRRHTRNRLLVERLTSGYDIFVNFMFLSNHRGHAAINIYRCMFPPRRLAYEELYDEKVKQGLDDDFVRSYDCFATNSGFTDEWTRRYWGDDAKCRVIHPPSFSEETAVGRYIEEGKQNIILSVGRFQAGGHNKKQDVLVDFFLKNPESFAGWELHLAGGILDSPAHLEFAEKIRLKIGGAAVRMHVNCPLPELMALYGRAKIFWHATGFGEDDKDSPEKMEHFGITTVEAMSYGAVPVVIRKGGQMEIVSEGMDGFLWDTEAECVSKTRDLISNDLLRIKMAGAATDKATRFSTDQFQKAVGTLFSGFIPAAVN